MAKREYPGYPEVVVIALPKCGTKTLNKCFTSLGYKVFDVQQVRSIQKKSRLLLLVTKFQFPAYAVPFDDYGTNKITFAEMAAKVWEENKYDVVIEPAGIYWHEMAEHWPKVSFIQLNLNFTFEIKTKFINIVREVESWKQSVKTFIGQLYDMPDDLLLDQVLANNKSISPTAHFAFDVSFRHYCKYIVGQSKSLAKVPPWLMILKKKVPNVFNHNIQVSSHFTTTASSGTSRSHGTG